MHELPIAREILKIALDSAQSYQCEKIISITLLIGDLSSIIDESLQFIFHEISKNTIAGEAKLIFKREAAIGHCLHCNSEFEQKKPLIEQCPFCHSLDLTLKGGQNFLIESMEIDQ